jgi:hypothetical protein
MKISFISEGDAANVLTEYSYCLNKHSEDIESKSICTIPHPFNYNIKHDYNITQCSLEEINTVKQWILNSDIIIFNEEGKIDGNYRMLEIIKSNLGIDLLNSNKQLIIWHPGSNYRNNVHYYNTHPLRNKIDKHLYAIDLYRLSPQNNNDLPLHTYQYYEFDYDNFISKFKQKLSNKPYTILHIPSNTNIKGSAIINKCMVEVNLDKTKYVYKTINNISNDKVLKEKENSIFYIDQVNQLGGYGVAMIEALFRANLTFCTTHNILNTVVKLTGLNKIPVVSLPLNPEEITKIFKKFFTMSDNELLEIMKVNGHWIDSQYNPQNIIKYFKTIVDE